MSKAEASIQKRLAEYKANPIQPLELENIQTSFERKDCAVESFKAIYKQDPMFCYALIGEATKATRKRISSPFAADHAMSTIGLKTAGKLFKDTKPSQKPLSMEVRFSLTTSLLAAELAKNICEMHSASKQAYWTALCYLLPDTMLWHLSPKEMWYVYYRQLTKPQKVTLFEESKFGFNLFQWRNAVASELHLSDQNKILFEKQFPSNPKELLAYAQEGFHEQKTPSLKDWHRYEGWLIVMANRLARAILIPWHNSSYRHIFNLIHQLAGCDKKKLNKAIQDAIRTVSENLQESQLPNPAVGYLMLKSKPAFPQWLINPQMTQTKSAAAKAPVNLKVKTASQLKANQATQKTSTIKQTESRTNQNNKAISATAIKVAMQKLVVQPESFASPSELIQFGLKSLLNDLKLDRVSFMVVDYGSSRVITKVALNAKNKTSIKPDFEFKQHTPLSKFIERQAFMLLTKKAHKNIWSRMPLAVQKDQVEHFVLCSLQPGKRVRALIYADTDDVTVLSPQRLAIIKKMLLAINKGLTVLNAKKEEKGPTKKAQAR